MIRRFYSVEQKADTPRTGLSMRLLIRIVYPISSFQMQRMG